MPRCVWTRCVRATWKQDEPISPCRRRHGVDLFCIFSSLFSLSFSFKFFFVFLIPPLLFPDRHRGRTNGRKSFPNAITNSYSLFYRPPSPPQLTPYWWRENDRLFPLTIAIQNERLSYQRKKEKKKDSPFNRPPPSTPSNETTIDNDNRLSLALDVMISSVSLFLVLGRKRIERRCPCVYTVDPVGTRLPFHSIQSRPVSCHNFTLILRLAEDGSYFSSCRQGNLFSLSFLFYFISSFHGRHPNIINGLLNIGQLLLLLLGVSFVLATGGYATTTSSISMSVQSALAAPRRH